MKMSSMLSGFLMLMLSLAMPAMAQEANPVSKVLITNARIFDGQNEELAEGMSVLVGRRWSARGAPPQRVAF